MLSKTLLAMGLAFIMILYNGCAAGSSGSQTETRLRERISLIWSSFLGGDFETFSSILSERNRREFSESDEEWQKHVNTWKSFLKEKPTFEVLDLQIADTKAKVKMRESIMGKNGSRIGGEVYDDWVFENGDWFLDDAGRTK